MASAVKRKLSGSTSGKGIKLTTVATTGDTIHTAVAGTTAGTYDEIWIWAQNNHSAPVALTIEFGSTSTDDNIILALPSLSGLTPVLPGFVLQNSLVVSAFASVANVVTLHGFVNSITD